MMHASIFTRVRPPARHSLLSSHLVHALTRVRANRRSPNPPIRIRRQTSERPARARSPSIRSLDGGRATRVPHLLFLPIPHAHPQRLRLGERASLTALRASRKNPRRRSRASLVSRVVRVVASSRFASHPPVARESSHRVAIASSRAPSRRYTDRHASFPSFASSLASRLVVASSSRSFVRSSPCRSPTTRRRVVVVRHRLRASLASLAVDDRPIDRLASVCARVSTTRRRRRRARVDVCRMRRFEFPRRDASGTRRGRDANDDRARRRRREGESRRARVGVVGISSVRRFESVGGRSLGAARRRLARLADGRRRRRRRRRRLAERSRSRDVRGGDEFVETRG